MFLSDVFPADDTVLDGKGDGMIDLTGMVSRDISYLFIVNITDNRSLLLWFKNELS